MKNLNKKISAVALASMVVLGGVAASGIQSFAGYYGGLGLLDGAEIKQSADMKELQDMIDSSPSNKHRNHKVIMGYSSEGVLENDARLKYPNLNIFPQIPIKSSKHRFRLYNYLSKYDVFIARYNDMYYLVSSIG